jgi:broad specificity phosphatase PhoE
MNALIADPIQTRLLLLCRGPLDWSQGGGGDPPPTSEGILEAQLMAATLPHFDVIAASPMRASQETAEAVLVQRPVAVDWRDGLNEIMCAAPPQDAGAYGEWLDRLFTTYTSADTGESLADGADRMTAALRGIADRYYGRATLVISHPVVLLSFRARLTQTAVQRDQVDALPPLAHSVVDYLEGRFYLVQDFPVRRIP